MNDNTFNLAAPLVHNDTRVIAWASGLFVATNLLFGLGVNNTLSLLAAAGAFTWLLYKAWRSAKPEFQSALIAFFLFMPNGVITDKLAGHWWVELQQWSLFFATTALLLYVFRKPFGRAAAAPAA